jgi:integrase
MPRLTRSLPKYRKHKASGQALVTIAGREHYLGPHGSDASKEKYDRLVAEWLSTGRQSSPPADRNDVDELLVVEVLDAYWAFAQGYYVKNGEPTNELDAMRLVIRDTRDLYGRTPAADFGPRALKAVRQRWIERGQARPTINKNMRRLTRIFRWAVAEEMIPGSVTHALAAVPGLKKGRCLAPEPAPILPVSLEVVERTMPHLPPVTADMIRFQLLTGARPGEVCKLTPGAIDRSGDVWEYRVEGHKTEHHGRERIIYIGPAAQAVLRPYLLRDASAVCFSMAEAVEQRRQAAADARVTPPSCGNRRGKRSQADRPGGQRERQARYAFDTGTYRKAIHHACDRAFDAPEPLGRRERESNLARMRRLTDGQKEELREWRSRHRWHPNQLRHTRATEVRKQFGLEAAQVILGHAAANITEVYAERDAEKAREVARQIG